MVISSIKGTKVALPNVIPVEEVDMTRSILLECIWIVPIIKPRLPSNMYRILT